MGGTRRRPRPPSRLWRFEPPRGAWVRLPERRGWSRTTRAWRWRRRWRPALYGCFRRRCTVGRAGTTGPSPPLPPSAPAQGRGWQDIGVVTTAPVLLPWNATTLPDGGLRASGPVYHAVGRPRGGADGSRLPPLRETAPAAVGGCSLRPEGGRARATALGMLGHLGLPLVVLLAASLGLAAALSLGAATRRRRLRERETSIAPTRRRDG